MTTPGTEAGERFRENLRSGQRLIFREEEPEDSRIVNAVWIKEAVAAKLPVHVEHAIISGSLDLAYDEVEKEFSLIDCQIPSCDFSHATFRRNFSLQRSECKGEATFARVVFEADALFAWSKFLAGTVFFRDIHAKGVFFANGIAFADDVRVSFNRARLDRTAHFIGATFGGPCSFRSTTFEQGAFQGAHFKAEVHFNSSRFGHHALFRREPETNMPAALFDDKVHFDLAQIDGQALFQGVVFKKDVSFFGCQVKQDAYFDFNDDHKNESAEHAEAACCFEGDADFGSMHVEGHSYFGGTVFSARAHFGHAMLTSGAHFTVKRGTHNYGAHFNGPADFGRARAGGVDFRNVVFQGNANFSRAVIDGDASFSADSANNVAGCVFGGGASFRSAVIAGQADFRGATFGGRTDFNSTIFERGAFFRRESKSRTPAARFDGQAEFIAARFGAAGEFSGTQFQGPVSFDGASFAGTALFSGTAEERTLFADSATFSNVHFGREVNFQFTKFVGNARFDGCRIDADVRFSDALFDDAVVFTGCRFGRQSNFERAAFKKLATFNTARFDGDAFFGEADFMLAPEAHEVVEADFRGAYFTGIADFQGCTFRRRVDFYAARCDSFVRFQAAIFDGAAIFVGASFKAVDFSESGLSGQREQFADAVDLRGLTYDRISANWRTLLRHAAPYDRQPYAQLEKALRMSGEDAEADEVYLERQTAERKKKWRSREAQSWAQSALYWLFLRYGVRPYRLFAFALVLLALGGLFFQLPGAVILNEHVAKGPTASPIQLTFWSAVGVSVRQFLPFDVPIGASWIPTDKPIDVPVGLTEPPQIYAVSPSAFATIALRLPGWLLLPLIIAGFSGLARRKS